MASLHYLTVQDILWINLQVTKKVRHFNYARLEEASFYQYAYGESRTLFPQAARFVGGFVKMHPFDAGNEATALVACLAFLGINGFTTAGSDETMGAWFQQIVRKEIDGAAAIEQVASQDGDEHHAIVPDVRNVVKVIMDRYASVVESLTDGDVKQTA